MIESLFCSWSGGKDAALALYRSSPAGVPTRLLTMMTQDGTRSRSHGLRRSVLKAQAERMGMPITFVRCSWSTYEERFREVAREFASAGVTHGIFGDIDFQRNREWVERLSASVGIVAIEPLWGQDRRVLLNEFLGSGFRARIVVVRADALPRDLFGVELTQDLITYFEACGCDPSGEGGEYHTVTADGPLFSESLVLEEGRVVERGGYHVLDLTEAVPDHLSSKSRRHFQIREGGCLSYGCTRRTSNISRPRCSPQRGGPPERGRADTGRQASAPWS